MFRARLRAPSAAMVIAFIALFVALSGTAVAVAPTVVNIADPTTPTQIAKVNTTGALSVTGATSMLAPAKPFAFVVGTPTTNATTIQIGPTKATIAITGIRVANGTGTGILFQLDQWGDATAACAGSHVRYLGSFAVPSGETVEEQLTTPIILKPLAGTNTSWCVIGSSNVGTGSKFETMYNGYVISGTYTPPATPSVKPLKPLVR